MSRPHHPAPTGPAPTDPGHVGPVDSAHPLRHARTVALAAVLSLLTSGLLVGETRPETTLLVVDQVAGGLACVALLLRARWPAGLTVVLVVASAFSHFLTGPLVVALFGAATRCRVRTVVGLVALSLAVLPISLVTRPESRLPDDVVAVTKILLLATVVGWGLFVRYRRELATTLYRQAQRDTRETVAREMHDVLAHRLSLLSVHAGALEYRTDASPEQVRRAAGVIRDSAHRALEDLREVIGILRADPAASPGTEAGDGAPPQPTWADLPGLVTEARQAGDVVELRQHVDPARPVPTHLGRTAYRVVQEGLTNARKHAAGQAVHVTLGGGPGRGLTVEVRNQLPERDGDAGPSIPGGGLGLVGVAERVELAGGRLHRARTGGEFRLRAWLPWPA